MGNLTNRNLVFLAVWVISSVGVLFAQNSNPAVVKEVIETPSTLRAGDGDDRPILLPPPPSNDACASAISLTAGSACQNGTTSGASTQSGEALCINPGGGITPETVWYRFTATNDSLVLGFVLTNTQNCATVLSVYGPFSSGGGCLPTAGNQILCQNMGLIDPGFHPLLTGLTIGQDYLVQVQGNNCGGGNDRFANFCIGLSNPSRNGFAGGASTINNCGVAFTGNTRGGHWANGTSTGSNNLDNNLSTSIAGASEAGDDVTFVINNISWFTFCNGNTTTCTWSLVLNNINSCLLSGLNAGVQAAVFTGSPSALTNVAISPSRIAMGSSWSSGNFNVSAGQCVYIAVDGFAGDECNYDLTLTNVTCPCQLLPIDLAYFAGRNLPDHALLDWEMNNQEGLLRFELERSSNPYGFEKIADVMANNLNSPSYQYRDFEAKAGWNYYRLVSISQEGVRQELKTLSIFREQGAGEHVTAAVAENSLTILLNAQHDSERSFKITDLQGRRVAAFTDLAEEGQNRYSFNIGNLAAGMYILTVEDQQGAQVARFVKH